MTIVDVFVPSVDQTYNCSIDEHASVQLIIRELAEMIEQREQTTFLGSRDALTLASIDKGGTLPLDATPYECGITTGARLMLL